MTGFDFIKVKAWIETIYKTRNLSIVPYGYTTTFLALAQNATASNLVSITANADFVLLGFRHRAAISAAQTVTTKTAPFVRVLITDSGSNEQFTGQAVDLENYSTNGGDDRSLPFPRWIGGRTALTVQATNYAPTAETYSTLDLFLDGLLVRRYGVK